MVERGGPLIGDGAYLLGGFLPRNDPALFGQFRDMCPICPQEKHSALLFLARLKTV